jgi:hypothetical protein
VRRDNDANDVCIDVSQGDLTFNYVSNASNGRCIITQRGRPNHCDTTDGFQNIASTTHDIPNCNRPTEKPRPTSCRQALRVVCAVILAFVARAKNTESAQLFEKVHVAPDTHVVQPDQPEPPH